MALRWGIASSGKIASDFTTAINQLNSPNHQLVAVAARSKASADEFAKRLNVKKSYEGYDALAKDADVEVVYIGVLNPQHHQIAKLMLESGKHVLCEKPFTMNERQTAELVNLARSKKLFLMEAVWSRCFPAYRELRTVLDAGLIGDIQHVSVEFGFPLQLVDRLSKKDLGGGATLDLGVYILQFQQYALRGLTPTKVVANGHLNAEQVDDVVSAIITYPDRKTAVVTASACAKLSNTARIVGSKGVVEIPEFWAPTKLILNGEEKQFPLPSAGGTYNFHNSAGLAYEADVVRENIRAGRTESAEMPLDESIQLARLMDTLRHQVGVIFPEDEAN